MDIIEVYKNYCKEQNINFTGINENIIIPDDNTTLFCTAGMQFLKNKFNDKNYKGTEANIQRCFRLNDLNRDTDHFMSFLMMGLFSFREMSVKDAISFWVVFIKNIINLNIDEVTIHPDRESWSKYYEKYDIKVVLKEDNIWKDNNIYGYCTEFFSESLEIGNIVNPLGNCIDVGFGYDRLNYLVNGITKTREEILLDGVITLINAGIKPGNNKREYILKKLLREIVKNNIILDHEFFYKEKERQEKLIKKYNKLKDKYKNKSKEWWFDTLGIDIALCSKKED